MLTGGRCVLLLFFGGVLGCAEAGAWLDTPLAAFPGRLSGTGVYEEPLPDQVPTARAFGFTPRYPLSTNGLGKDRFVLTPGDARLEVSGSAWSVPAGTVFVKTFQVPDGPDAGRPVETRLLRRLEDGWDYAAYRWRDDGSDADRLDLEGPVPVTVEVGGDVVTHRIPDRFQCRMCHESNPTPLIGFSPMQLSAEDGAQLDRAVEAGIIATRPATVPAIAAEDPRTTFVLRYAEGNCNHCHNGLAGGSRAFDLAPEVFLSNTVGVPTSGSGIDVGLRIDPGSPDTSVLFRMLERADEDVEPMPPVGADRPDPDAVAEFRRFIEALDDGGG